MIIPSKGSTNFRLLEAVYTQGAKRYCECQDTLELLGLQRCSADSIIKRCRDDGQLQHQGNSYDLTDLMRKYFDMIRGEDDAPVELVKPRVINVFSKPMSGYEAAMRQNIRSDGVTSAVGYHSSDTSPEPFRGVKA